MKYSVAVKPGTSQEKIVENEDGLVIYLRAKAHDGEANKALMELLAKHFNVPKTSIKIVRGLSARSKIIEL